MGFLSNIGSAIKSGAQKFRSAIGDTAQKFGSAISTGAKNIVSGVKNIVAPKPSTPSSKPSTSSSKPSTSSSSSFGGGFSSGGTSSARTSSSGGTSSARTSSSGGGSSSSGRTSSSGGGSSSSGGSTSFTSVRTVGGTYSSGPTTTTTQDTSQMSTAFPVKKSSGGGSSSSAEEALKQFTSPLSTFTSSTATSTPRLSGLGIPSTPTMPGDTKSSSAVQPDWPLTFGPRKTTTTTTIQPKSSYKDYTDVTGSVSKTLNVGKKGGQLSSILGDKVTEVMTSSGGVSTAFPERYSEYDKVKEIFGPSKQSKVEMPTQSFAGRIDPEVGKQQVEQLYSETEPLVQQYEYITSNIEKNTPYIKGLNDEMEKIANNLEFKEADLKKDEQLFQQRLKNVDLTDENDVAQYNADVEAYQKRVDEYNSLIGQYFTKYEKYKPQVDAYNANIVAADKIYGDVSTKGVMAGDIIQNINRSLVPEAIVASTAPVVERYGPGGVYEYPGLITAFKKDQPGTFWDKAQMAGVGQIERVSAAGKGVFLALEKAANPLPKDKWWGKVGNFIWTPIIPSLDTGKSPIEVNPAAIRNPVTRDVLQYAVDNPLVAAGALATSPTIVGALAAGATVEEGTRTAGQQGYLSFLGQQKDKLYTQNYTPEMDKEARQVMLGSIEQKKWYDPTGIPESVNLGFMSPDRLQTGVDALDEYYKMQGLPETERNFRIIKSLESFKIDNQAEWLGLAAAGIGTNIIGAKGVGWAERVIAPKIKGGIPFLQGKVGGAVAKGISKIPSFGLGKAIGDAGTKTGARYLATRFIGMAPAGAVEGIYFTGAQVGGRYFKEMTPQDYARGGIIGGLSAPAAQIFIERNFPRTVFGGVQRPERAYSSFLGQKFKKPTVLKKPTLRESFLFGFDPLEPVSDALTDIIPGAAKGVRTLVAPITTTFTEGTTWTSPWGSEYTWAPTGSKKYTTIMAETQSPTTSTKPYTTVTTQVSPYANVEPYIYPREPVIVMPETRDITKVKTLTQPEIRTQPNINMLPEVSTQPKTFVNTLPFVETQVLPEVIPREYTDINPYIEPYVQVQPQVEPNVFVTPKAPIFGWLGGFSEGTGGGRAGRKSREWIVTNPIADYGDEWIERQKTKGDYIKESLSSGQQFRLAPQGVAVVNRINPMRQQFRPPQIQQQQFIMPQRQYKFEQPTISPRQRAQHAVERGFGKLQKLDSVKVNSLFKTKGKKSLKGMI